MHGKILIVEDNEKNRMLIVDVLSYHGYEVLESANGAEGVSMAIEHSPDLILMDLQMPVMDGVAALKALRADGRTSHIKVVAVTAFAMKGDMEKILAEGFDGYITKPLDTRTLPETINDLISTGRKE